MGSASTYAATSIVHPNQVYSYKIMTRDLEKLASQYPDIVSYESLGQTKFGRQVWAIKLGRGESVLLLNGSHHAREWMTTTLLMKMIESYAATYYSNTGIGSYNVRQLLDRVSIYIVPMVNPDGVALSQQGTAGLPAGTAKALRKMNGNSSNFNRWKSNMQGIDLNRQYPAAWNRIQNNKSYPWYQFYKGNRPAQAPEVQMMMDMTYRVDPEVTISYHSSGEIIFWHFNTHSKNLSRDQSMARDLSRITGYSLVQPQRNPSGGGYKDWFIQEFDRPGFTIEIAPYVGERSVPLRLFNSIWSENKTVGLYSAKKSYDLWLTKQKVQEITVSKPMSLLAATELYAKAGAVSSVGLIGPQELTVTARKGDWYRVSSTAGIGWIQPSPGKLVEVEAVTAAVDLTGTTPAYAYPDKFAPRVTALEATTLAPQTVRVTGRWGRWLQISTGTGTGAGMTSETSAGTSASTSWIDGRNLVLNPLPDDVINQEEGGTPPGETVEGESPQGDSIQGEVAEPQGEQGEVQLQP